MAPGRLMAAASLSAGGGISGSQVKLNCGTVLGLTHDCSIKTARTKRKPEVHNVILLFKSRLSARLSRELLVANLTRKVSLSMGPSRVVTCRLHTQGRVLTWPSRGATGVRVSVTQAPLTAPGTDVTGPGAACRNLNLNCCHRDCRFSLTVMVHDLGQSLTLTPPTFKLPPSLPRLRVPYFKKFELDRAAQALCRILVDQVWAYLTCYITYCLGILKNHIAML